MVSERDTILSLKIQSPWRSSRIPGLWVLSVWEKQGLPFATKFMGIVCLPFMPMIKIVKLQETISTDFSCLCGCENVFVFSMLPHFI